MIQSGPASELASLAGIGAYLGKFDQETFEQSIDWFQDNLATIMDDAYAGTYWLYPCAVSCAVAIPLTAGRRPDPVRTAFYDPVRGPDAEAPCGQRL